MAIVTFTSRLGAHGDVPWPGLTMAKTTCTVVALVHCPIHAPQLGRARPMQIASSFPRKSLWICQGSKESHIFTPICQTWETDLAKMAVLFMATHWSSESVNEEEEVTVFSFRPFYISFSNVVFSRQFWKRKRLITLKIDFIGTCLLIIFSVTWALPI